tara:strand:+ start:1695 stop:2114 length:420 start_codon:yes stop_codon:yes gene_type:complete
MDFKNINNFLNLNNSNYKSEDLNKPKLIDPGVKYFFKNILKECNNVKNTHNTLLYNLGLLMLFILTFGSILFFRYKNNKSKQDKYLKNLRDKQYIMSKLAYYNKADIDNKQRIKNNMITNLPDYNTHPEASLLHRKIYF